MGIGLILVVCIVSLFVGIFSGLFIAKFLIFKQNKKIQKNAQEVLDGKRKNVFEAEDGGKYEARKFVLRNDDGEEEMIDLKNLKGGKQKYDKEKKANKLPKEEEIGEVIKNNLTTRKDSRSRGEKKRNSRIRKFS